MKHSIIILFIGLFLSACQTKNEPEVLLVETGLEESNILLISIKVPNETYRIDGKLSIFYGDGSNDEWPVFKWGEDGAFFQENKSNLILIIPQEKANVVKEQGITSLKFELSSGQKDTVAILSEKPEISITNSDLCKIPQVQEIVKEEKYRAEQLRKLEHEKLELEAWKSLNGF